MVSPHPQTLHDELKRTCSSSSGRHPLLLHRLRRGGGSELELVRPHLSREATFSLDLASAWCLGNRANPGNKLCCNALAPSSPSPSIGVVLLGKERGDEEAEAEQSTVAAGARGRRRHWPAAAAPAPAVALALGSCATAQRARAGFAKRLGGPWQTHLGCRFLIKENL